jgi:hypothetical protein
MLWLLTLAAIKAAESSSLATEIESHDRIAMEAR